MRKYLLNFGVLTSIGGAIGLFQATKKGPRDWRLLLMWIGWAVTVGLAMGAVSHDAEGERKKQHQQLQKKSGRLKKEIDKNRE
jgi:hypothetical protein